MISEQELINHYQQFFYTVNADTKELKQIAYQLRYRIFVQECGYKLGDYDDEKQIETDEYDEIAHHSLLFNRASNQPIGYIRLIPFINDSGKLLPIEDYGRESFDNEGFAVQHLRTETMGEISRMGIISSFRRRKSDKNEKNSINREKNLDERRFPLNYLPGCIALAGLNLLHKAQINHSVAMMEPQLSVILKHFGIQHHRIGHAIEFHGMRTPFMIDTRTSIENLKPGFQSLFEVIRHELFPPQFAA